MYLLVAHHRSPEWNGEIAREVFDDLNKAEKKMTHWARFGVDAFCNTPHDIWILDETGTPVRIWDWKTRSSVQVEFSDGKAGAA